MKTKELKDKLREIGGLNLKLLYPDLPPGTINNLLDDLDTLERQNAEMRSLIQEAAMHIEGSYMFYNDSDFDKKKWLKEYESLEDEEEVLEEEK